MSDERDLREELLRQNGIEPGSLPDDRRKELRAMIERDKVRERGAKFGALFGCGVGCAVAVVIGIVRGTLGVAEVVFLVFVGLAFFLAFMSISLWFIGMYFGQRQMQASLADISAQLEQLTKNQQANPPK